LWKYYSLGKLKPEIFNCDNIAKDIAKKLSLLHNEGKRSFLMKVVEKDALINRNMTLLVVNTESKSMIKYRNSEKK
jgi:hypothetical protein